MGVRLPPTILPLFSFPLEADQHGTDWKHTLRSGQNPPFRLFTVWKTEESFWSH